MLGDSIGAGVVHQLSKKDLREMDELKMMEEEEKELKGVVVNDNYELNTSL